MAESEKLSQHKEDAFGSSFVEAGCFGNEGDVYMSQHFWLVGICFILFYTENIENP